MESINNSVNLNGKKTKALSLKAITEDELAIVLRKHECWVESDGKEGQQANLRKYDLSRRNFSNANLQGAKLNGSSLYNTNLQSANLKGASLRGTLLIKANLDVTDLTGAVMEMTQLRKASCRWTRFDDADISRANFELAEIEYASFVGVKTGEKSLEEILARAKVNVISIGSLSRKEELIEIVKEPQEDKDVLFSLNKHYLISQELNSEKINVSSKQQELTAKEPNLKEKEEFTDKWEDSKEQNINSLAEKPDSKEEDLREQEVDLDEEKEFPWITESKQGLDIDDDLLDRTEEPVKTNQPITLLNRISTGTYFNLRIWLRSRLSS